MEVPEGLEVRLYFKRDGELVGVSMKSGVIDVNVWRYKRFESMLMTVTVYNFVSGLALDIWNELDYETGSNYMNKILDFLSSIDSYELSEEKLVYDGGL